MLLLNFVFDILNSSFEFMFTLNGRACMRALMLIYMAKDVCQTRSNWKAVVSAYPGGKMACNLSMYIINQSIWHSLYFFKLSVSFYVRATGSRVAILNGHTFSRHCFTNKKERWACSSKDTRKCKAFFFMTKDLKIVHTSLEHNHPPSKFLVRDGVYFKI